MENQVADNWPEDIRKEFNGAAVLITGGLGFIGRLLKPGFNTTETLVPSSDPEAGLPHSFFTEDEVKDSFSGFDDVKLELDQIGRWFVTGRKHD